MQPYRHRVVTSELPCVGVEDVDIRKDRGGEIHVFAHPDSSLMLHQDDSRTGQVPYSLTIIVFTRADYVLNLDVGL